MKLNNRSALRRVGSKSEFGGADLVSPLRNGDGLRTINRQFHCDRQHDHIRIRRTATLLFNGRVLITGGYGSLAELYDTITGTFTATGDTTVGR